MSRIRVSEFVALDGVFESPSWTMEFGFDPKMGEAMGSLMGASTSDILLGRVSYTEFGPAWSSRSGADDPGAPFMNDTPKHVVTSAGSLPVEWSNSSVFGPYDAAAVSELRANAAGDIWVTGSGTLVRALLSDGLVDELHLFVYPVLRGTGRRLFADGAETRTLALGASEVYDNGVVHLAYSPAP